MGTHISYEPIYECPSCGRSTLKTIKTRESRVGSASYDIVSTTVFKMCVYCSQAIKEIDVYTLGSTPE